jgi:uncharacterized protein (DUF488 family)
MSNSDIVYTIGYEGTDIERFVATLKAVGIETLADVRAVAVSRKKGFSKRALRERLEAQGIRYEHFVDLGDPKEGRDAARQGRHSDFERIYHAHIQTDAAQEALRTLSTVAIQSTTCLMCFERDPKFCHRTMIADGLLSYDLASFDLFGDSPEKYVKNRHLLPGRHPGQSASAA